jgi:hypothetical protein
MTVVLPDLGPTFTVQPLTANRPSERATAGRFSVGPGVYVLSSAGPVSKSDLPARLGELGFAEYHAPPHDSLPLSIQPLTATSYLAGHDAELRARIVDATPPDSATLFIRPAVAGFYRAFKMRPAGGYEYAATVASNALEEGPHEFVVAVFRGRSTTTFPAGVHGKPWDWDYEGRATWPLEVVSPQTPLRLFSAGSDAERLAFTRIGDAGRRGLFRVQFSDVTGLPVFHFERPVDARGWSPDDYTASLVIKDRVIARWANIANAKALQVRLRGLGPRQRLHITLMEDDGTSWTAAVTVDSGWTEQSLPLDSFVPGRGVLLPEGFPGEWNYWVGPAAGRGTGADRLKLDHLERLQLSLRREEGISVSPASYGVEVESIVLR